VKLYNKLAEIKLRNALISCEYRWQIKLNAATWWDPKGKQRQTKKKNE